MGATDTNPTSFGDYYFPMASEDAAEGDIACINAAGYLTPGAAIASLVAIGVFKFAVENAAGAVGSVACPVMTSVDKTGGRRVFPMKNSATNPLTQAHVMRDCYIEGPQTVGNTSSSGTLSRAGRVWGFSPAGNPLVEFDVRT